MELSPIPLLIGTKTISAKRLKNEWSLIRSVLNKYCTGIELTGIELPQITPRSVELPSADSVLSVIKGTDIELPVLLAAWLSFSMSEVRGLTKSKSISSDGDYLTIKEVVVDVDGKPHRKDMVKNPTRNRKHRIPDKYAQERGGWKSDQVMKSIYMNTFSEEREKVDNIIDKYFGNIADPADEDVEKNKYKAWLTLFEREDGIESKKDFLSFMQHEMQHKKTRA